MGDTIRDSAETMGLRLITARPRALEAALAEHIRTAQKDDPLEPVGVLLGGTLMRPYLQRRMAELCDGIANVRFMTVSELALTLGESRMTAEGSQPLPPLADRVLLRQLAAAHDGYFAPVRETPGFADALHRLTRELRGAGYDGPRFSEAVAGTCAAEGKDEALAALFGDFLAKRKGLYGPDDCLLVADPDAAPWTSLAVFGLWDAPGALRACLEALGERIPVTVFLPATGSEADGASSDFSAWLAARGAEREAIEPPEEHGAALAQASSRLFCQPEAAVLDGSIKLLSGPDPSREIREVARTCLAWAREGIGFHEMAVVYRHADAYRPVIEAVFAEAGIPLYLHEGTPLVERPVGRRAAAVLGLVGGDLERRAVMDFVTDSWLPRSTREAYGGAPAARWDRYSREAGVVAGLDQWEQRLRRYRDDLAARGRDGADDVEHLRRFVVDLDRALHNHEPSATWSVHLNSLRRLLGRYVQGPDELLDALDGLSRLDAVSGEVSFDRFLDVVRGAIETLRSDEVLGAPSGAFGRRGVNVLDANSMRHLAFRAVAIVGLAERTFPPAPRPDPLLLDPERVALNESGASAIPLRVRGPNPEPLQFALAVAGARDRLLATYPRKSAGDGRPQLPSSFFRALAEATVGKAVPASEVDTLPSKLYERVIGSRIGAAGLEVALSASEHDRTLVERQPELGRAALVAAEPRIARAFASRAASFQFDLTPYDGVLGERARELIPELRGADKPFSPSSLETYAECPRRWFLANLLRVRPVREPEATIRISPLDKGSLVHRIFERFLCEPPEHGPLLHGPGEEARLLGIADQECDRAEREGETGYSLIWRYDRGELHEDLRSWLESERRDPSFTAMPHGQYEVQFGTEERPIEIAAGGARLRIAGRIDRLNWDDDHSTFRVIDYKTGKPRSDHVDAALRGGRALQLPLYLLASAELTGIPAESGSAEYHFATRGGGFQRKTFTGTDLTERREDVERVLAGIVDGIWGGIFQMAPLDEHVCDWCDFNALCPSARWREIERKGEDPHALAFAELRAVE